MPALPFSRRVEKRRNQGERALAGKNLKNSIREERALRTQAARTLLRLFDTLYEGAIAIDRDGRITWANGKYKALLGWNGTVPLEGCRVEEVIPGSRLPQVARTGRADLLDIFTVNGRETVVSRIPLFDDRGQVIGALGVILYDRIQALQPIVSKFQRLKRELDAAQSEIIRNRRAMYRFDDFIGRSPAVRALKAQARRVAQQDSTVLLLGETGTGKELLAHAIHASSPRAMQAMVRVNAAAIPESLLESELFGVAPGAFTGADRKGRKGKFELADGGTLFLDEVGDMPLKLQAKLLRILEGGELEALGSNAVRYVNVRLIAATSRNLEAMVGSGDFRADLYYRLNVVPLRLPPLRERREDIVLIARHLLERFAAAGLPRKRLGEKAATLLESQYWRGNVRELSNLLEQAVLATDREGIDEGLIAQLLPSAPLTHQAADRRPSGEEDGLTLKEAVARCEKRAIEAALEACGGNRTQAAKRLSISRARLYEKMNALGILSGKQDK